MKKGLWVLLGVAMLAGCGVGQTPANSPVVEMTVSPTTVAPTIKTVIETPPATTCAATLEPTPEEEYVTEEPESNEPETEEPLPDQETNPEFSDAPMLDISVQSGTRLSDVAVSNDAVTYYRMDVKINSKKNDYRYDYYTRIMRYDKRTGKSSEVLNTKGKGFIFDFYLHDDGVLYYVLGESIGPDRPSRLCKYQGGKTEILLDDVFRITHVEDDTIYYQREVENQDSVRCEEVAYNVTSRKKKVVCDDVSMASFDLYAKYIVRYRNEAGHAVLQVEARKDRPVKNFIVEATFTEYCEFFVYDNKLFMIDHDMDKWQSTITRIDIDGGSIQDKIVVNGYISDSVFYHGKWYFYSSREDKDESVIEERLSVCDLDSGKITLLAELNVCGWNHLRWASIEAGCGYIWIYRREGGDGFYAEFIKKIKIPTR